MGFSHERSRGITRPRLVALAFEEQIQHDIPREEHDVEIDCVFTATREEIEDELARQS